MSDPVICVKCMTHYRTKKIGVELAEMLEDGETHYKIWHADLLECPGCKAEVVTRLGQQPIAQMGTENMDEAIVGFRKELDIHKGFVWLTKVW